MGAYKARDFFLSCERHCDLGGIWINGFGGELARGGMYWKAVDTSNRADGNELCRRAGLPPRQALIEAFDNWLAGLQKVSPEALADRGYLENRISSLVSPRLYGAAQFTVIACPFLSADFICMSRRVLFGIRRSKCLLKGSIAAEWPSLIHI